MSAGEAIRSAPGRERETAEVVDLTHDGEGIVRSGKTAFVAGALPGETVSFERIRKHRRHDEARLLEVLRPAPERVVPRCAHFGVCGGCALQHLEPEAQLALKEKELRDNLERVARVEYRNWLPPLRGPVWEYRRRARLGAKYVPKKGKVVVGFRERLAPYVADVTQCEVLAPPVGTLVRPLSDLLGALEIRQYVPQIEVAVADNATALVLRVLRAPTEQDRGKLRDFAARHAVRLYLQSGGLDSIEELTTGEADDRTQDGTDDGADRDRPRASPLSYGLPAFNLTLEFTPTDFVQVNGIVNQTLVSRALELLRPDPTSRVLDLYCGLGNFTLALARSAGRVVGVEGEPGLVERARHNALRNGISNVEFHAGDLSKPTELPAAWLDGPYTHVLLDPPRVGATSEMLAAIARPAGSGRRRVPERVLYVSCHPGSLARDLGILVHELGFTLESAGVVDMFPHTAHVESMALLVRS
ncbi:MAG TPA: 23S rRNA (uracil(1939)-C(5))-methyltransferase RlmD [Steroidobacteraceae bacterium]|nr:23S rRNA (uracil(1939)-C(5))-methyltransferase RlmD [Steroidobacteraceae bacterium]